MINPVKNGTEFDTRVPQFLEMKAFREAFLKAKAEFKPLFATATNPHFKNKYSTLADIFEATDEPLRKNGLTIHQVFESRDHQNFLVTKLCHIGGYCETSSLLLLSKDPSDPQRTKAASTYYRRMELEAILGIATEEDDDGNSASGKSEAASNHDSSAPKKPNGKAISPAQAKRFYAIMKSKNWGASEARSLLEKSGYKTAEEIQWSDYQKICDELERGPKGADEPPPFNDSDIPF